jgi:DNA-binding MarR family transcriptional regulator
MTRNSPSQLEDLARALFRSMRAVGTLRLSHYAPDVRDLDKAGLIALLRLAECGPVRISELAAHLTLDLSTVSRQVKALDDGGLIERHPDPEDKRATLLTATDRGREVAQRVIAARRDLMAQALSDWTVADRATLTRLLQQLADDLSDTAQELHAKETA